jgi:hypothetical protein
MERTSMQRILLVLAAATALAAAPRAARACGRGNSGAAAFVLLVVPTNLALTLWDGGSALASHRPSAVYGLFETAVAVPQVVLGVAALASSPNSSVGAALIYTAWTAFLAGHGLWTIAHACEESAPALEDPPEPPARDEPLLQVRIGPTYVPVGQLAQPGIGLVGRF